MPTMLPLTSQQREIWFFQQMHPALPLYNIGGYMQIRGALDAARFRRMLDLLIVKHDALRLELQSATDDDGVPFQAITAAAAVDLLEIDLSSEAQPFEAARRLAETILRRPFALIGGRLFRYALIRLAEDHHLWVQAYHHLIIDGRAITLLCQSAKEILASIAAGTPPDLDAPSFAEQIDSDRRYQASPRHAADRDYWLAQYATPVEPLFAPRTDAATEPISGRLQFPLSADAEAKLAKLAEIGQSTQFQVLLGLIGLHFARAGQRQQVVIGMPVLNRPDDRAKRTVGLFTNVTPMMLSCHEEASFVDLLDGVRHRLRADYRHQRFASAELLRALGGRGPQRRLFDVCLSYEREAFPDLGEATTITPLLHGHEPTPVMLFVRVYEGRPAVFDYAFNLAFQSAADIEALHARLLRIIDALAADPHRPLSNLDILPSDEVERLRAWAGRSVAYPSDRTVAELFAEAAAAHADREALVDGDLRLSYAELDAGSDRLARRLVALGVGPDCAVAVCLDRSAGLVTAALAVLKAGGCYVPISPDQPAERRVSILTDCRPAVLLTAGGLAQDLSQDVAAAGLACPVIDLAGPEPAASELAPLGPLPRSAPGDLAYLIFTSGSTGRPKGVMIEQRSLVNMIAFMRRAYELGPADRTLQMASAGFDVSLSEIFPVLCAGGTLVIASPPTAADPVALTALLAAEAISYFGVTPLMLSQLRLDPKRLPKLRLVFSGGEALSAAHHAGIDPSITLVNGYGPTEATIGATAYRIQRTPAETLCLPIGRPVDNHRIYILDGSLRPLPAGVAGELCIAGDGLARGYLGAPELTAERFVEVELFGRIERIYRSGDKARWLDDGNLQFLGRLDRQVKLRGYRIELGEVEAALSAVPGVRASAVRLIGEGEGRRLVGYVAGDGLDPASVTAVLKARLPDYMIPRPILGLDTLPLNANGKVDTAALPEPVIDGGEQGEPPRDGLETELAAIWAEVLGCAVGDRHQSFFDLGGHSLTATRLVMRLKDRLGVDLPLAALFEASTIEALANRIADSRETALPALLPLSADARPELSFAQQRLWFLDQLDGSLATYAIPAAIRLDGPLDRDALRRSFAMLVARHEGLRQVFVRRPDGPDVAVLPPGDPLGIIDLSAMSEDERAARVKARLAAQANAVFDLETGPLFRAELLCLGPSSHLLFVEMHHIVSDGWSLRVLFDDLRAIYGALCDGREPILPRLPIRYVDYAAWQRRWLQGPALDRLVDFWREALAGAPQVLDLPRDRPRPAVASHSGGNVRRCLAAGLGDRLAALGRDAGATPFMTLLAAFGLLLARLSGETDLLVGTPSANRTHGLTENLVGFFVNTLVLRLRIDGEENFVELLRKVRRTALDAYAHQELPFETLVEALNPERSLGRSPLFQVMFTLENADGAGVDLPGLRAELLPAELSVAKFDLTLGMGETPDGLVCDWEYAADLFERSTIERFADQFEQLLAGIAADPERPLSTLSILSPAETSRLRSWTATAVDYPSDRTVAELFEAAVSAAPEREALVDGGLRLSYGDLDAGANRLAHRLEACGVGPDRPVAVCLDRSAALVTAALAVLKAGGCYVPISPDQPAERRASILGDCRPAVLLTAGVLAKEMKRDLAAAGVACPVIDLEQLQQKWEPVLRPELRKNNGMEHAGEPGFAGHALAADDPETWSSEPLPRRSGPGDLAYLIFTSGSTGRPKGVMIEQHSLVNMIAFMRRAYHLGPADRTLLMASVGFDVSLSEIFPILCAGGTLVIARHDEVVDPRRLTALLAAEAISSFGATPLMLSQLRLDRQTLPHLRLVFSGGEALSAAHYAGIDPAITLVNGYGPTEATIGTTAYWIQRTPAEALCLPIGRPVDNHRIYILDNHLRPQPIGIAGELCIAGDGLARGYLGAPELTAERFVEVELFGRTERIYRSGDKARWLDDGNLQFLGRLDRQVKLRGYRIELGEVEAALSAVPGVRASAVRLIGEGEGRRLVGYVAGDGLDPASVTAALRARLPDYMIPRPILRLDILPLNANGKVDTAALPLPEVEAGEKEAPRDGLEAMLADLWSEVLGCDAPGIHDNFFELGGHSLRASRLAARLQERVATSVPVRWLFEAPTIAELADRLRGTGTADDEVVPPNRILAGADKVTPDDLPLIELTQAEIDHIVATVDGGVGNLQDIYPLAPLQEGILYHHLLDPAADPYGSSVLLGFDSDARRQAFLDALQQVIARHDVLRTAVVSEGLRQPVQVVWRSALVPVDRPHFDPARGPVDAQFRAHCAAIRLDLAVAPMRRAVLCDDGDRRLLALIGHHLTMDHTTAEAILKEIGTIMAGGAERLPASVPYRGYIARTLRPDRAEARQAFFTAMLGDVDHPTAPFGLLDASASHDDVAIAHRDLVPGVALRLRAVARRAGVTPAALLHLAFALVLARVSAQRDVVFGTVLLGRLQGGRDVERALGLFINTLPLRVNVDERPVVAALADTQRDLLALMRHEDAPLGLVQRCSALPAPAPLFSSLINYRHSLNRGANARVLDGVDLLMSDERSNYPLGLSVDDFGDDIQLSVGTEGSVDPARVLALIETALAGLVEALEQAPDRPLCNLDILPSDEVERLRAWAGRSVAYPSDRTVAELFAEAAAAHADREALVDGDLRLSYAALDAGSDRLARRLVALGVGPDCAVAVCLDRSAGLVTAALAVLKAGGCYVPISPDQPAERRVSILTDCRPAVLLTAGGLAQDLSQDVAAAGLACPVIDLAGPEPTACELAPLGPLPRSAPGDLAYLIFTSGSTGRPKGVMIEQRSLVNMIAFMRRAYELGPADRTLQMASAGFDVSLSEIFPVLCAGGTLVIAPPQTAADPVALTALLAAEAISYFGVTPLMLSQLRLDPKRLPKLRLVFSGGEALSAAHHAGVDPSITLVNGYGPTEATIGATAYRIQRTPAEALLLPIGRPVDNHRIYILDGSLRPLPAGVAGELCIAGDGLARGYLGAPELTAERFVEVELFGRIERIYRSGDKARWLDDGNLQFLGRLDRQVKLRGYRIELGEVEAALSAVPGVRASAVRLIGDGENRRLVGYVAGDGLDPASVTAALRTRLPDYMIPRPIMLLDTLPLNANGKVDTAALPEPVIDGGEQGEPPRDDLETELAAIWAEVLGCAVGDRHQSFFDLGGHSLRAVRLTSRIEQQLGRRLRLADVLARPTIAEQAALLAGAGGNDASPLVPMQPFGDATPIYLLPGAGGHVLYFEPLARHLGPRQPVFGLEVPGRHGETLPPASVGEHAERLLATLRRHDRRGPWRLIGHSAGAHVAFEMARLIEGSGETVEQLWLLDAAVPTAPGPEVEARAVLTAAMTVIEAITGRSLDLPAEEIAALSDAAVRRLISERLAGEDGGFDAGSLDAYIDVYAAMADNLRRYRPSGQVSCPVTLVVAADGETGTAEDGGWAAYVTGGLSCLRTAGNHMTMLTEPHVAALARLINRG